MKKKERTASELTEALFEQELIDAQIAWKCAKDSYNNAEGDFIDIALMYLNASELILDATIKKGKLLGFKKSVELEYYPNEY